MRNWRKLVVGLVLGWGATVHADPELLSSFSYIAGENWGYGPPFVAPVAFWLEANDVPLEGEAAPLWEEGQQGTFDFTPGNTPNFGEFSALCTDGVPGAISTEFAFSDGQHHIHGSWGWSEASFFGVPVDLVGQEIDFVRLVVHSVDFWYDGELAHMNADITWECWGTVPEPASALLLVLGVAVLGSRNVRWVARSGAAQPQRAVATASE